MGSNPESFVSPNAWAKHRSALETSLVADDARFSAVFNSIDRRNARFSSPDTVKELSPRRRLIQLLDATFTKPLTTDLPRLCWQIDDDKSMIIQTVLEWSSSSHRPGATRIYVGARVLRFCSRSGVNVTEAVLNFLASRPSEFGCDKPAFYHLISELARSEHFSVTRYLQWLVARGGIYNTAGVARDGPCATRLLAELPTHNVSQSMAALRRTLLDRAGYSTEKEEQETNACMALINNSLPAMHADADSDLDMNLASDHNLAELIPQLSRSTKSEIGLWLRQKVRLQILRPTIPPLGGWEKSRMRGGASAITVSDLSLVRHYLEKMEDYSMLADVLKIVARSNNPDILASCANTLDLHLDTFAAIGALKGLFDILVGRLRSLNNESGSLPRVFLVSLSDLAARMPEQKRIAQKLAQELALRDRKTAADACSPVSDHMALVQTAEANFTDEIEKVLASGSSMDQPTLERLFQRISLRLEDSWTKSPEQHRSCGLLLTRLRTFDAQQFDLLMAGWVNRFMQMPDRPSMIDVLGPLISFGCLTLSHVVANGGVVFETLDTGNPAKAGVARELLSLVIPPSNLPEVMTAEEAYRLRIKQSQLQKGSPVETLTVIRRALENSDFKRCSTLIPSSDFSDPLAIYKLLQRLVLVDADSVIKSLVLPLLKSGDERIGSLAVAIVDRLLAAERYVEGNSIAIEVVLDLTDDFTLPFCQVKLVSMFAMEDVSMEDTEDEGSECLQALDKIIERAVAAQNRSWSCIVPLLDSSTAQRLRRRAETHCLAAFPSPKSVSTEDNMQNRIQQAKKLFHIVEALPTPSSSGNTLASQTATTLSNLCPLLSIHTPSQTPPFKDQLITYWIPLLLSIITPHTTIFESTKLGHESLAKEIMALAALLLELATHGTTIPSITTLIEQTFDISLCLVDSLPDDMRLQCIRTFSLRHAAGNFWMSYLFSIARNPSDWLVACQREKGPIIPPGMSGPEARALVVAHNLRPERISPFVLRRWEILGEAAPHVGANDTSLSLTLFGARKV
jgi:mediator of RNA polymerase II transcription subunit 12